LEHTVFLIVAGCDWFQEPCAVRDELTHRDAQTIILPGSEGIPVAMFNRIHELLDEPELPYRCRLTDPAGEDFRAGGGISLVARAGSSL
jgi:hypothetical protein